MQLNGWELLPEFRKEEGINNVNNDETLIDEYWLEFVDCYLLAGRSETTILNVRDSLRFLTRELQLYSIESFNQNRELRKKLMELMKERGWSPVTYNSYLKNLNTYFIWLEKEGLIDENHVRKVMKCKEPVNSQLTLSGEQVNALLAQVMNRRQTTLLRLRNLLIVQLLITYGMRNCELLQMQCADVCKESNSHKFVIRGRKQKGGLRYYRMPSSVRDGYLTYMDYRRKIGRNDDALFISSSKKKPLTESGLRKLFEHLSDELGFKVSVYPVRRYVATKLYGKGMELHKIADYLGHTKTSTTLRYIERTCCRTDDCVEVMGR